MIRHYKLVGSSTSLRSRCASPTPGFLFCLVRSCSPRCNACRDAERSRKEPETPEKGQPALLHAVLGFIYFVIDPVCVGELSVPGRAGARLWRGAVVVALAPLGLLVAEGPMRWWWWWWWWLHRGLPGSSGPAGGRI